MNTPFTDADYNAFLKAYGPMARAEERIKKLNAKRKVPLSSWQVKMLTALWTYEERGIK